MIKRFKQLSKGVIRLSLVGYLIWAVLFVAFIGDSIYKEIDSVFFMWLILLFGYWIIFRLILWVYDGFFDSKK